MPIMSETNQDAELTTSSGRSKEQRNNNRLLVVALAFASVSSCVALGIGYFAGKSEAPAKAQLPAILGAAATATDNMAVATGPISRDAEGVFFLDFITGDLQCLVYYPQAGTFGARYYTNVRQQLGGAGKSRYLLVTGAISQPAASSTRRPGASLVYVTDVNSGMFAAYAVPYDNSAERSRTGQGGPMVPVEVGPIRNFPIRGEAGKKPAAIVDPAKN
ncbi:MAG: hypothetical protein Aurels2KO_08820 [Aureliella sp.]